MAWDEAWKAALSDAQHEPVFLVDVGTFAWADPEVFKSTLLGDTFASQPWVPGISASLINGSHTVSEIRTGGQSVRIRDWTTSRGGFSFSLTSSKPGRHALPFTPYRGLHVQIRLGFSGGFSSLGFEAIERGMIDNITHDGDTWWVQCRSMLDVLRTRYTDIDGEGTFAQFFEDAGQSTTLTNHFNSGHGNDLDVDSLDDFKKDNRTGAVGVAKIEGDASASRPSWWFVYSAKSAATGAGTLTASGSADWFGNTTTYNYPSGTKVYHYPVATGKPWKLFARFIRSSGAGASSGFDTMPAEWGAYLPLYMVDSGDITSFDDHVALYDRSTDPDTSIDPKWTPFVTAPVTNMLQFLEQGLGQFNMWPVVYHDQLSVRMAYDYLYFDPEIIDTIDDDWIASIDGHDLYHPDADVEYKRVGGTYNAAGDLYSLAGDDPKSRPWLDRFEKTISANGLTVIDSTGSSTENSPNGQTCWEAGTSEAQSDARVLTTAAHTWYTRIPEYLKITTRTLRHACLVPGDLVSVTSAHIIGREGLYTNTICMVTGVTPDWMRGRVSLELAILPARDTP